MKSECDGFHLVGSAELALVYSPTRLRISSVDAVLVILIFTGLWMWQGHRMKKFSVHLSINQKIHKEKDHVRFLVHKTVKASF